MNASAPTRGTARPRRSTRAGTATLRLGARAFDFVLALIVVTVGSLVPGASESSAATIASFVLVAFAVSAIEAVLLSRWGRTPGMALCGLHVSMADGSRVPVWRAWLRSAVVWTSVMAGCFVGGGAGPAILVVTLTLMIGPMVVRGDQRGGHDLLAGTRVDR